MTDNLSGGSEQRGGSEQSVGERATDGRVDDERAQRAALRRTLITAALKTLGLVMLCIGTGALAGVIWKLVVHLPGYVVAADGGASTTERGLSQFFGRDAWYSALALGFGVALGAASLRTLARLGWPSVVITALGATLAGMICWVVGYWLGPGPFEPRLAAAKEGDFVPIELTLSAPVALVVWPFAATIPLLLWSSLTVDPDEERSDVADSG